jgi:hypothetical protein
MRRVRHIWRSQRQMWDELRLRQTPHVPQRTPQKAVKPLLLWRNLQPAPFQADKISLKLKIIAFEFRSACYN